MLSRLKGLFDSTEASTADNEADAIARGEILPAKPAATDDDTRRSVCALFRHRPARSHRALMHCYYSVSPSRPL